MANGFNAPRIIGQGSVQQGIQVDPIGGIADSIEKLGSKREDTRRYEQNFEESQRRYEKDFWENAKTNMLRNKMVDINVQQFYKNKYDEEEHAYTAGSDYTWKPGDEYRTPQGEYVRLDPDNEEHKALIGKTFQLDPNEHQHIIGSKVSWPDYLNAQPEYQQFMTPYSRQLNQKDYIDYLNNQYSTVNPPGTININPVSGNKEVLPGWGYGKNEWAPGKFLYKGMENLFKKEMLEEEEEKSKKKKVQKGSYIPGNRTGDKNPAMLEDGEYVLNRNAVKALGKGFLDHINNNEYPRFQRGGFKDDSTNAKAGTVMVPQISSSPFEDVADLIPKFQTGGFTGGFGLTGMQSQIQQPVRLESTMYDDIAEGIAGLPGKDPTMDYSSLEGSGLSNRGYDRLVKERQSGWDDSWDDVEWQQGGYIKPKGYQQGGLFDIAKPQSLSLMGNADEPMSYNYTTGYQQGGLTGSRSMYGDPMHQKNYTRGQYSTARDRAKMQAAIDEAVWQGHRDRQDQQKSTDLAHEQAMADYEDSFWGRVVTPNRRNQPWNPLTWTLGLGKGSIMHTEEEMKNRMKRSKPQYVPGNYLKSDFARQASLPLREAIRSGADWKSEGSVLNEFDQIQE